MSSIGNSFVSHCSSSRASDAAVHLDRSINARDESHSMRGMELWQVVYRSACEAFEDAPTDTCGAAPDVCCPTWIITVKCV